MKKKLLFVMNSMTCGGAEKSLISFLQTLDYSAYEVDLFLFKHEGLFMANIPEETNLLEAPENYKYFDMPFKAALTQCLQKGEIASMTARLQLGALMRIEKNAARCEQRVWKYISKSIGKLEKKYDVAVGFLEKNPIYFIVDKVMADKKLGWIHTNYTNLGMDPVIDEPYFQKLDHIVTVSDECAKALQDNFQSQKEKIKVLYNIVSPPMIRQLAKRPLQAAMNNDRSCINITTVARLNYVKGIDFAVLACKLLAREGYPVIWKVLGLGSEKETRECKALIEEHGLTDRFLLLGVTENPYPFIENADIYVQPSRLEGKSIAVDEAKILRKPIVVTNFPTAKDQIDHERNGLIVAMNPEGIAEGIKRLLNEPGLMNTFSEQLAAEPLGTEAEVEKFYQLIS
ncbi:glycosyltransferase [Paenibacillus sp. N4]|uniref:glycosyltransferase n=1 Tax=Paenibacillus vietnamensis TaxID=2590547 RepID=UPI001CD07319|nr:glycosyltransferase [Paenibacillus vietnamensis]MCA0755380.1 glycosyltransferase [Paenibacillus vietnamensis]